MNQTFKVIGRHKPEEEQPSWCHGKEGIQAKKTVYTSLKDFKKYSPDLIKRWKRCYNVEVFELIDEKWIPYK